MNFIKHYVTPRAVFRLAAIVLVLSFCHALPSFGASSLSITPLGSDVYDLQGVGLEDVAALDITITYDAVTLTNPRISQGSLVAGALIAVNSNMPGTVRIAIVTSNPIRGSGVIATLTFNRLGNAVGSITALRAAISNLKGSPLPVVTQVNNQSSTTASTSSTSTNQGSISTASDTIIAVPTSPDTGNNRTVIGGLVTPTVETVIPEKQEPQTVLETRLEKVNEAPSVVEGIISKEVITTQDHRGASKEKAVYTQKSVLEGFRDLKGERSPKVLTALFNHESLIGFKQEPPLIQSNGKNTVKAVFIAFAYGKELPDVSLKGARLISIMKDPDKTNAWITEIKPDEGVNSAELIVLQDKVTMVFPLTVASKPKTPLGRSDKVTEADFNKFLKERGLPSKQKYDLNGDGKRDYVDDYIFTANYILSVAKVKKSDR